MSGSPFRTADPGAPGEPELVILFKNMGRHSRVWETGGNIPSAMRWARSLVLLIAAVMLWSCTNDRGVPAAARELAPTGKLRVGLFNRNPVYVTRDDGGNTLQGVSLLILAAS
jgi:hypothetical protein